MLLEVVEICGEKQSGCCSCCWSCAWPNRMIIPTSSSTELTACDENPTCLLFPADLAHEADVCFLRL